MDEIYEINQQSQMIIIKKESLSPLTTYNYTILYENFLGS